MVNLTIFRIKDGVTNPDLIIKDRKRLHWSDVRLKGQHLGILYVRRFERFEPSWLAYFDGAIDLSQTSLRTASVAAVLLLSHNSALYALTFGFGRYLLCEGVVEDRFGLRVTLNAVEPTQLRSIDHKRLDVVPRHTHEQLGKAGHLTQFGLDVERDLLRAVTGSPVTGRHGHRLMGSNALTVTADIPLAELTTYLEMYEALARDTSYRTHFPWVDNVAEVTDGVLRHELDERLIKAMRFGKTDAWLAPPEMLDWNVVSGFQYRASRNAKIFADLDLEGYFEECGSALDLDAVRLKADHVYCIRTDQETAQLSWSIRRCIVAEIAHQGDRYVLSEGSWFRVDPSFAETVDQTISSIAQSGIQFPPYRGPDEGAYNIMAAKHHNGNLFVMDKNLINVAGRGTIEACDLYSTTKQFIHVKRYGASSTLSHLFSQGTVSAQLLVSEAEFRKEFHKKLPSSHHWGDSQNSVTAAEFEVCYAVIAPKGKALALPFFSRVNLRAAVRLLTSLGFRVSFAEIKS